MKTNIYLILFYNKHDNTETVSIVKDDLTEAGAIEKAWNSFCKNKNQRKPYRLFETKLVYKNVTLNEE